MLLLLLLLEAPTGEAGGLPESSFGREMLLPLLLPRTHCHTLRRTSATAAWASSLLSPLDAAAQSNALSAASGVQGGPAPAAVAAS